MRAVPTTRKLAFAVFAALIAVACVFQFGSVIVAGLFSYMVLDLTYKRVAPLAPDWAARWIAVLIFLLTAALAISLTVEFVKLTVHRIPVILNSVLPTIDGLASRWGVDLPFDNLRQARAAMLGAVRENAASISTASGLLTRGFFQVVIGVFIAVTKFLSEAPAKYGDTLYDQLAFEVSGRVRLFMTSFERVLGVQFVVSLVNAAITALFLSAAGIPFLHFLTLATFMLGIIPLLGHVASNALIVGAALTLSPEKAAAALVFLVLSHKVQYVVIGRILGNELETPVWLTLLGLVVGEVALGVPGMILAPAFIYYLHEELTALPPA